MSVSYTCTDNLPLSIWRSRWGSHIFWRFLRASKLSCCSMLETLEVLPWSFSVNCDALGWIDSSWFMAFMRGGGGILLQHTGAMNEWEVCLSVHVARLGTYRDSRPCVPLDGIVLELTKECLMWNHIKAHGIIKHCDINLVVSTIKCKHTGMNSDDELRDTGVTRAETMLLPRQYNLWLSNGLHVILSGPAAFLDLMFV